MTAYKDFLPREFTERMDRQLKGESEAFFDSYSSRVNAAIRLNTSKIHKEELPFFLTRVPWAENGFYVSQDAPLSRHPFYFAGCYYIQEASAMLPAECLHAAPGDLVLDLCAAPGGKATELARQLQGQGLLIANDVSAGRANALLKNLTMWGAPNSCVTAERPERLLEMCGSCFDKILVDAPCSGEGMFRRNPSMAAEWQKKGPSSYTDLQKEILSSAVNLLKPGGILAYSTCTFSEEENEEVVSFALEHFPELHLLKPKTSEGFAPGIGKPPLDACVRLYPHRVKGEGHFLALMKKSDRAASNKAGIDPIKDSGQKDNFKELPGEVRAFMSRLPENFLAGYSYRQIREQCLFIPPFHLPRLRYLRSGVLFGRLKSGRFEPSQDLAMLLCAKDFDAVLDLKADDPRVKRYLKGETILLTDAERIHLQASKDGWILVCVCTHALGWGKVSGANLKNKLYPGWRYR